MFETAYAHESYTLHSHESHSYFEGLGSLAMILVFCGIVAYFRSAIKSK